MDSIRGCCGIYGPAKRMANLTHNSRNSTSLDIEVGWLETYSKEIESTDTFRNRRDHLFLLAGGLIGETGSIVAEIKKIEREKSAYPGYCDRLSEELGDFLWYYVRLVSIVDARLLLDFQNSRKRAVYSKNIRSSLKLAAAVGALIDALRSTVPNKVNVSFRNVWSELQNVARGSGISLKEAAEANVAKIRSRWPLKRIFHTLFDESYPVEEQLPRRFRIRFIERRRGNRIEILLRSNGIGVGDRVTDNIADPDGYRYHDIFHIAYAVFLGWSPVVRGLLRCKRKSKSSVDENQDGARAQIIEEGVAAIVFSRAKKMNFFKGAKQIDYDLLKTIQTFVSGYEVDQIPIWQWELAILEGFRLFRSLQKGPGGTVTWDISRRTITYARPLFAGRRKGKRR